MVANVYLVFVLTYPWEVENGTSTTFHICNQINFVFVRFYMLLISGKGLSIPLFFCFHKNFFYGFFHFLFAFSFNKMMMKMIRAAMR